MSVPSGGGVAQQHHSCADAAEHPAEQSGQNQIVLQEGVLRQNRQRQGQSGLRHQHPLYKFPSPQPEGEEK